jgi:hypothetical protein
MPIISSSEFGTTIDAPQRLFYGGRVLDPFVVERDFRVASLDGDGPFVPTRLEPRFSRTAPSQQFGNGVLGLSTDRGELTCDVA